MNADELLWDELHARQISSISELTSEEAIDLVSRYGVWIPVQAYENVPWLAPYAIRRSRVRSDVRVEGEKRDMWGFPDERGYFTDDNSLIKQIHKGKRVHPSGSPYQDSKLSTGMVCCHVWSGTTQNPLLFSFIPNLVWLPKSLAPLSDNHDGSIAHPVHDHLKRVSMFRFREHGVASAHERTQQAWAALNCSGLVPCAGDSFEMSDANKLIKLANGRVSRLVLFVEDLLGTGPRPKKFSKRYHAGVGRGIDKSFPSVDSVIPREDLVHLLAELRSCQ